MPPREAYDFRSLEDPVVFIKGTTDSLGADVRIDAVGAEAAGSALQTVLGRKLFMQGGSATALHWSINSVKKGGIVSIVGGDAYRDQGLVFPSRVGTPMEATNLIRGSFKPLLRTAGLPDIRFHDLRHTCATIPLSRELYGGAAPTPGGLDCAGHL